MTDRQKVTGLLATIAKGLILHSRQQGAKMLGDRTKYIGMSDVGAAFDCMRKAVMGKLNDTFAIDPEVISELYHDGEIEKIMQILRRELILQRGHWQEFGLSGVFQSLDFNQAEQLEIKHVENGVPIHVHVDFCLVWDNAVRIIESKSTGHLPDTLYGSYEQQLYGQIGLLHDKWNTPSFNMKDSNGENLFEEDVTFPELVKQRFGRTLSENPVNIAIEGWVLALSLNDAAAFGPYYPNADMTRLVLNVAQEIWTTADAVRRGLVDVDQLDHCRGFNALCDYCPFWQDCPRYSGAVEDPEFEADIVNLDQLKAQRNDLDAEINEAEQRAYDHFERSNLLGKHIVAGEHRMKVSMCAGRSSFIGNKFDELLIKECGISETKIAELRARCTAPGKSYKRVTISKIPQKSLPKAA